MVGLDLEKIEKSGAQVKRVTAEQVNVLLVRTGGKPIAVEYQGPKNEGSNLPLCLMYGLYKTWDTIEALKSENSSLDTRIAKLETLVDTLIKKAKI